jgi:hypothetical protein
MTFPAKTNDQNPALERTVATPHRDRWIMTGGDADRAAGRTGASHGR